MVSKEDIYIKDELHLGEETQIRYRTCTKCKRTLPATLEFFSKEKGGKFGLRSRCLECRRKEGREYKKRVAEKHGRVYKPRGNKTVKEDQAEDKLKT